MVPSSNWLCFLQQIDHRGQPVGVRQSPLEQVADGPTAPNAIKRAVGVEPFKNIGLQPNLHGLGLGFLAGLKATAGISRRGAKHCHEVKQSNCGDLGKGLDAEGNPHTHHNANGSFPEIRAKNLGKTARLPVGEQHV